MFSANSIRSAVNAASSRNRLTPLQRPRLLPFGLSAFLAFLPLACSGPSDPAIVGDTPGAQPKATLQVEPASFNVSEGGTLAFRAKLGSQAVGASQLTWSVSPSSVATMDAHGVLTAVKHGEAVVTARYSSLQATARGMVRAIPQAIQALSSTSLTGIVGRSLVDSLAVRAVSSDGTSVPGVEVAFQVLSGAGSLSHAVRATGDDGVARVDWTLGTAAGQQQVRARAEQLGELVFGAEAVPDFASATVEIVAGDAQEAQVVSFLPEPLKAQVVDRFGNVLPGYAVHWGFSHGGGSNQPSGSPGSTFSALSTTTDAQGMTQVFWRLGTEAGLQQALCAPSKGSSGSSANTDTNGPSLGPPDWAKATGFRARAAPAEADTVEVTPDESSTAVDKSHQLSAQVLDQYGNIIQGSSFVWTTDGSGVVAVDNTGLVYGLTVGKAEVFAQDSDSGLKGSAWVNVSDRVPASVQGHSGGGQKGVVGTTLPDPVVVRVLDSSGSPMQGVTVTWSVAAGPATGAGMNGAPAASAGGPDSPSTLTNSDGMAETTWTLGTSCGEHTLEASVEEVSSVAFTAEALPGPVASVAVTPPSAEVEVGGTRQFTASATDEFGNPCPEATFTWSSSNAAVATVNSAGLATAVAPGSAEIRATANEVQGHGALTVTEATTPPPPADEPPGTVTDLEAIHTSESSVTLRWTQVDDGTGNPANYAVRYGTPTITWSQAQSTEVVVEGTTTSGSMEYTYTDLEPGTACQFRLVSYRGTLEVDATFGGLSNIADATTETITQEPTVVAIEVTPASAELEVGESQQFSAVATDQAGNPMSGITFTWSSSNTAAATVSSDGLATAVAEGSAEIRAGSEGETGDAEVTVVGSSSQPQVASVAISPSEVTLEALGATAQLTAVAADSFDNALTGISITWAASDSSIVEVDEMGVVTARAVGLALVIATATCCEISDTVEVRVTQIPTAVELSPSSRTLNVGESYQFIGVVKDAMGHEIPGLEVTWSSGNTSIASVCDVGTVTGQSPGTTEIRGVHEGLVGEASVGITENSGLGRYPNEPAGFVPWFEHDWQSLPPVQEDDATRWDIFGGGWPASGTGYFNRAGHGGGVQRVELIDDPEAPHGFGKSMRIEFPEDHPSGTGYVSWSHTSGPGIPGDDEGGHTDLDAYYISFWLYLEPDPRDGLWRQFGIQRLFTINRHYGGDLCAAAGDMGFSFRGGPNYLSSTDPAGYWWMWPYEVCESIRPLVDERAYPGPSAGNWYHVEFAAERLTGDLSDNEPEGDSQFYLWINGIKVFDDVVTHKWDRPMRQLLINLNPSAGATTNLRERTEYIRLSGIYVSGRRID